ncbi:MAG: 16S rRNA pseudouridine(516) synthase [Shewanella sp.]|nr:16S rRNA pseudouridine(516) synthase [Shewanella sp.]MCF1439931.1 16S rRNA pseudouridine(516) synthase [Shewanella sp.]MCF1456188.1 16S rRNA pseudouridine(516) synthase [Shewanella sp.]
MESKRARLDRFLAKVLQIPRKQVRQLLLARRVKVNGIVATEIDMQVNEFSCIALDEQLLRQNSPRYYMVHKPVGVVSATNDELHGTVLALLPEALQSGLHIVGRLDLNTSGLVLLTNDSRWSCVLMQPGAHVEKEYWVTLANPLTEEYAPAFALGMYFGFEDMTTNPAQLEIIGSHTARVVLTEGKYHQLKRMFGRFRNPVVALHRSRIGGLELDDALGPGQWRALDGDEVTKGLF